jgi:hypothetical protein
MVSFRNWLLDLVNCFRLWIGLNVNLRNEGIYGAWGVDWEMGREMGRAVTSIPSYRANIRPLIQDFFGVERDEFSRIPNFGIT